MTSSSRLAVACLSALIVLLMLPATSDAQELPPAAKQMAKTYGLDSFGQVEAIRFTFTIAGLVPPRTWEWQPKTDTVTYEGKDKDGKPVKVTYKRSELDSQSDAVKTQIDPGFVNDQYWLLLPLHFAWDGATVTDEGMHETPLGKTSARKIVAKYAASGYSPGDTWDLYVGPGHRAVEMTYHRAVPAPGLPNVVNAKWAGHKKAGPLLIATDHPGTADGNPIHLSLLDVSVKLKGSETWINAQ
jgi:cytochrome c-type biogenesis protein CcmE